MMWHEGGALVAYNYYPGASPSPLSPFSSSPLAGVAFAAKPSPDDLSAARAAVLCKAPRLPFPVLLSRNLLIQLRAWKRRVHPVEHALLEPKAQRQFTAARDQLRPAGAASLARVVLSCATQHIERAPQALRSTRLPPHVGPPLASDDPKSPPAVARALLFIHAQFLPQRATSTVRRHERRLGLR